MEDCYKNVINVRKGYWRRNNLTDALYLCSNKEDNCVGGTLDNVCAEGNIGGLCEACDIY